MYDRLTGSTTMIISSGGTTVPGSPSRPEYLKASVYLPPAFVTHNPDLHRPIIDIIQHYIETIGVKTVTLWTQRARRDLGYSLTQVGNPQQNPHFNAIPSPDYNSAHYTFLGQPYRMTQDPSASSVQAPSPTSSTDSYAYAFGEDPDASALAIIDLQQENSELHEQIHILQQKISDLEEEVKVTNLRHSSLTTRTHDRIVYLEGQIQRYVADKTTSTMSTPVRKVSTKPLTPLRYGSVTPSRAAPTRSQIPSRYSSPVLQTPDTSFKRHIQPSPGIPTVSHTPFTSRPATSHTTHPPAFMDESNADGLVSPCCPLLPHYINLYHLGHLSTSINLIGDYTPVKTRIEELLKLGLEEDVCNALAEAMALDKGLLHD
jgi:hypothetical protein